MLAQCCKSLKTDLFLGVISIRDLQCFFDACRNEAGVLSYYFYNESIQGIIYCCSIYYY